LSFVIHFAISANGILPSPARPVSSACRIAILGALPNSAAASPLFYFAHVRSREGAWMSANFFDAVSVSSSRDSFEKHSERSCGLCDGMAKGPAGPVKQKIGSP
jgi:hypothetical protein